MCNEAFSSACNSAELKSTPLVKRDQKLHARMNRSLMDDPLRVVPIDFKHLNIFKVVFTIKLGY